MNEFQPNLFEKLIDRDPENSKEIGSTGSATELIRSIRRNLLWLLNTTSGPRDSVVGALPHASRSVINFGIPSLGGGGEGQLRLVDLERAITESIHAFEPRLRASSIVVRATKGSLASEIATVKVEISGALSNGGPSGLFSLSPVLDLESGSFTL